MDIDLGPQARTALEDLARRSGVSVDAHVREAIAAYVADYPDLDLVRQRRAEAASGDVLDLSQMTRRLGLDG